MSEIVQITKSAPSLSNADGILLELDAAIDETHERSAEVSKHPVEEGADVSDHVKVSPRRLTINGIITASPLDGTPDESREEEAWEILNRILEAGDTLTVSTTLHTYENMVLTGFSVVRDGKRRIAPPLTFEEVRKVKQEWVSLPPEVIKRPKAQSGATETSDKGTQPPKVVEEKTKKSKLASAMDFLKGRK